MANVNIKFNNKEFLLSCDDGQEEHLEELSNQINNKFNDLKINSISSEDRFMFCGSMGLNNDLKKIMIHNKFRQGSNNYPGEFVLEKAFVG